MGSQSCFLFNQLIPLESHMRNIRWRFKQIFKHCFETIKVCRASNKGVKFSMNDAHRNRT
jgi:hypothetical protein